VKYRIGQRREAVLSRKNLLVEVDPTLFEFFQKSALISSKLIGYILLASHGRSADLLKASSKRPSTK
jgi:hypothetical protein